MTSSTPRITYRIGMRAGFGALADKSLPSLIADAEDEVAAAFKGILKILMGNVAGLAKSWSIPVTKVPGGSARQSRVGTLFLHFFVISSFLRSPGAGRWFWLAPTLLPGTRSATEWRPQNWAMRIENSQEEQKRCSVTPGIGRESRAQARLAFAAAGH